MIVEALLLSSERRVMACLSLSFLFRVSRCSKIFFVHKGGGCFLNGGYH